MRLLVETQLEPAGGFVVVGLDDQIAGPGPCALDDELRVECEVIEVRPSKSRPAQGLIKLRTTTLNQNEEAVLVYVVNMVVQRRKYSGRRNGLVGNDVPCSAALLR